MVQIMTQRGGNIAHCSVIGGRASKAFARCRRRYIFNMRQLAGVRQYRDTLGKISALGNAVGNEYHGAFALLPDVQQVIIKA